MDGQYFKIPVGWPPIFHYFPSLHWALSRVTRSLTNDVISMNTLCV